MEYKTDMRREIEFKDVSHSFPHDLQVVRCGLQFPLSVIGYSDFKDGIVWLTVDHKKWRGVPEDCPSVVKLSDCKPLLAPMRAITQPIVVEGYNDDKEFYPLEVIGKMYDVNGTYYPSSGSFLLTMHGDPYNPAYLQWSSYMRAFLVYEGNPDKDTQEGGHFLTLEVIGLLCSWGFDINGLLDLNPPLAINKIEYYEKLNIKKKNGI